MDGSQSRSETKEWALHHVLGLGDSAILLEPKELKTELINAAEKIAGSYST